MSNRLPFASFVAIASTFVMFVGSAFADSGDFYGPVNLLRTMVTPFGSPQRENDASAPMSPMSLHSTALHSLASRLVPPRLYLPGRMVIGQTDEFIIKGRPGQWAALAMADKNKGAKPICGRDIHLGADRKLVSLGRIPEGGVLSLVIDTPIQGDMIGQQFYFEAVVWSKPDFSDLEVATPVPSETVSPVGQYANGVVVAGEIVKKKGIGIVPVGALQMNQNNNPNSSSGKP